MSNGISTITDFYSVAQDRDFTRKNQLRVVSITTGSGISVNFGADDLVYAKTASLPERQVQTSTATFMGLDFNVTGNVKYSGSDGYAIEFFADQKFDLWNKFTEWTMQVFDDESSTGNYFVPKSNATIVLAVVDNNLDVIKTITLVGVACKSVGALAYDISDAGEIQQFPANFSYHYARYESNKAPTLSVDVRVNL